MSNDEVSSICDLAVFIHFIFSGKSPKSHNGSESETISLLWLPVFALPWVILYFGTLLSYNTLPTPILIENEVSNSIITKGRV